MFVGDFVILYKKSKTRVRYIYGDEKTKHLIAATTSVLSNSRHAVDYFRAIYDMEQDKIEKTVEGSAVQGTRLSNLADMKFGGYNAIEIFSATASQCTAESDFAAPVCDRIGIPLVLRRLSLSLTGRDRRVGISGKVICVNNRLRFLNPEVAQFDSAHGVGSAIAVRKEGKLLCYAHTEAFVQYGKEQLMKTGAFVLSDISMCSKEDFLEWYAEWKEEVKDTAEFDVDVPSPYEL
jgi:hypothetical protein